MGISKSLDHYISKCSVHNDPQQAIFMFNPDYKESIYFEINNTQIVLYNKSAYEKYLVYSDQGTTYIKTRLKCEENKGVFGFYDSEYNFHLTLTDIYWKRHCINFVEPMRRLMSSLKTPLNLFKFMDIKPIKIKDAQLPDNLKLKENRSYAGYRYSSWKQTLVVSVFFKNSVLVCYDGSIIRSNYANIIDYGYNKLNNWIVIGPNILVTASFTNGKKLFLVQEHIKNQNSYEITNQQALFNPSGEEITVHMRDGVYQMDKNYLSIFRSKYIEDQLELGDEIHIPIFDYCSFISPTERFLDYLRSENPTNILLSYKLNKFLS